MEHSDLIQSSIIRDMAEGVLTIGMDGVIGFANPAAAAMLGFSEEELVGQSFASCFFEYEENEAFVQVVLDAIYVQNRMHEGIVPFFTGTQTRQLRVTTSFLHSGSEKVGIIAVLSDMSELVGLRDAVKAMEQIRSLNAQLELRNKLLGETFGRFLSDEIVRQLLETPDGSAPGGKKRTITVLFSDLRGFTAMSESIGAQALIRVLNHYLGEMTEVIENRGGTIIEFVGDGILAIFGAPAPSETHADDAVAAAIEMQARMDRVNEWNAANGYPLMQMGIGLNTGEVIVGNVGSERRMRYGVIGKHVNLAARIEGYTVGGQVMLSPLTCDMVSAPLTVVKREQIFPMGIRLPVTISHVTGIGAPYNVSCREWDEPMHELKHPAAIRFNPIREKHVERAEAHGTIIAAGRTGARLKSEAALDVFDDLLLDIGGKLFAKVLAVQDGVYTLRFTALPKEFDEWLKCIGE